jgi:hypothetical protein
MENMIHQTSLKDMCQAWRTWYIKLLLKTGAKHGEHDTLLTGAKHGEHDTLLTGAKHGEHDTLLTGAKHGEHDTSNFS